MPSYLLPWLAKAMVVLCRCALTNLIIEGGVKLTVNDLVIYVSHLTVHATWAGYAPLAFL